MNKLIKISDTHYIVVDDSEIKEGDWYYLPRTNSIYQCKEDPTELNLERDFGVSKITHSTQPLERDISYSGSPERPVLGYWEITQITIPEVEEAINGYSVEKMAEEYGDDDINDDTYFSFIAGFKAHQELVKNKLFTLEDIKRAYLQGGFDHNSLAKSLHKDIPSFDGVDDYLQHIQGKTEWDIEFDEQGKLKLI